LGGKSLNGKMLRYSTSLVHPPIPVSDLGLGITAPAKIRHWVGYVAIGYQF
jgi:MEMO1 family protein